MNYFIYDGNMYTHEEAVISIDNRGFKYGEGIFETMKCVEGHLVLVDEHFSRLWKGMHLLEFDIPASLTFDSLQNIILDLVKKNNLAKMAKVRLTIFRGNGELYDIQNHYPHYIIQTWPLHEETGLWNTNGLALGIYDKVRKSCDILSNLKHNNYLPYVMAALHAKKERWDDAILLNSRDAVCDTTIANIFLIKNKIIYTTALEEGCVAGIMRKTVIALLKKQSYTIREQKITVDDVMNADEIFLTNAIRNIQWVKRIGDITYNHNLTYRIYSDFNILLSQ